MAETGDVSYRSRWGGIQQARVLKTFKNGRMYVESASGHRRNIGPQDIATPFEIERQRRIAAAIRENGNG